MSGGQEQKTFEIDNVEVVREKTNQIFVNSALGSRIMKTQHEISKNQLLGIKNRNLMSKRKLSISCCEENLIEAKYFDVLPIKLDEIALTRVFQI